MTGDEWLRIFLVGIIERDPVEIVNVRIESSFPLGGESRSYTFRDVKTDVR